MTREPADRLPTGRLAAVLAVCLLLAGCASTGALDAARVAEQQQDYDLAVAEYLKAARANPDDRTFKTAAELRGDLKRLKRSDRGDRLSQNDHSEPTPARSAPSVASVPPSSSSDAALAVGLARRHPIAIGSLGLIAVAAAALSTNLRRVVDLDVVAL